jgi:hypothetical protein
MGGALGWKYRLCSSLQAARLSSWLPGIEVADAWDCFWGRHHLALLRLVAKPSHVGASVDGLACRLYYQAMLQSLLTSDVLSCHTVWVGVALVCFSRGERPPS